MMRAGLAGVSHWRPGIQTLEASAPWISAVLVMLLAWSLAQLTWKILLPPELPAATSLPLPVMLPVQKAVAPETGMSLEKVAGLHLFGRPDGQAIEATPLLPAPVDVPDTTLRLSLLGVVASGDPAAGVALIQDERGQEQHYRTGQTLPGNARLEQVYPDRVLLSRAGRLEMLRLPRETIDPAQPGSSSSASASASGANAGSSAPTQLARELAQRRDAWIRDPSRIMESLAILPVSGPGGLRGFSVRPRGDAAWFSEAGLRPGDVIIAVNDIHLANIDDPSAAMAQLAAADRLSLQIERQGRLETLILELRP